MINRFKNTVNILCLCLAILPLTTLAQTNWKIIFRYPADYHELWIGNGDDERSARIFRLPRPIKAFSIQKDDRYVVAVAEGQLVDGKLPYLVDVYLLDRKRLKARAKNLTQGEYTQIPDVAISRNGDIIFINLSFIIPKNGKLIRGLYLIPFREIEKKRPKAELLLEVDAEQVDWAPNGKEIVYETDWGIFHFDIRTKKVSQVTKGGSDPIYSPDGEKIAFLTTTRPKKIGIKTAGQRFIKYIELEEGIDVNYLTWSADGQSLVYTLYSDFDPTYTNFAVHIESGQTEQIFKTYFEDGLSLFEWTNVPYAVDSVNKLTTLWGKLKQ
ncbi:MAG: hypothetical protein OXU23_03430 [Candidatus Poribacteria bacterium]|nr:hypothetical protein [Candidatus Poribacteria bacterium]